MKDEIVEVIRSSEAPHLKRCKECGYELPNTRSWQARNFCCKLHRGRYMRRLYPGSPNRATPTPYLKLRFSVLARDNFRYMYCGLTPQDNVKLQIDHIIPKIKGGSDDMGNLITACQYCNVGKGATILETYKENHPSNLSDNAPDAP